MKLAALIVLLAVGLAAQSEYVKLPEGSGQIGCPLTDPCSKTFPRKSVTFPPGLELMRYEVTVGDFARFAQATSHKTYNEIAGEKKTWKDPGYKITNDQPVVFVTLTDAQAYCAWAGARLPTDAEWEYAARAGALTAHYWGDEIDERYLWFRLNSGGHPHKGGGKRPNSWGLYDMEGNVWEWVVADPQHTSITKPGAGSLRGGSYITCPEPYPPKDGTRHRMISLSVPFPSGTTQHFGPDWRRDDAGFRCIRGNR